MENIFDTSEKLQIKISGYAHSSCHVLLKLYLKGTAITLPEVILYDSTLSSTNLQILTPKRYDEHPSHFYRGVPPPWAFTPNQGVTCVCRNFILLIFY